MLQLPPRDRDPFFNFYTMYLLTVLRVLERLGVRKADVPDIAQQVFLKISKNMDKLPAERVHTWIELICKQQAADHYRLHRNRFETPTPNVGEDIPDSNDVGEQFERCEMAALVKQVLDGMDAPLREVLVRYEFQDESLESIAKSVGIARNTVHARLAEAKRIFGIRVRKLLNDERRSSMFVPLFVGADALSDADLQAPAFVEEMRARIWDGIARDMGLGVAPESPSPKTPSVLRRILGNRGMIAMTSAVAGFIAALLWPHDVPAVAKAMATAPPVIVVQNRESTQTSGHSGDPPLIVAATTNNSTDAPAPNLVKSTAPNAPTGPKVHVDHELRTLEEARKFIASERYAEAIAALTRHQQQFPQSDFAATRSRYMELAQEGQRRTLEPTTP